MPTDSVTDATMPTLTLRNMTLLGLLALVDPPRKEVPPTVAILRRAGVHVAMVTGRFEFDAGVDSLAVCTNLKQ